MAAQYDAFRQEAAFEFVDGAVRAERIDTQIVCLIQHSGQFLKQMLRFFLCAFKNVALVRLKNGKPCPIVYGR